METKPPRLTFEWFRSELLRAIDETEPSGEQEAMIRKLWDTAHQAGRSAAEAVTQT